MSVVKRSFVSIVGQTAIASLQPLMAYRQIDAEALSSIELLVTAEVRPRLPGLERALAEIAPDLPLNIHALSQRFGRPEEGRPVAELYRELERRGPLAINIMGGTNFMSAAGLCALEHPEEHVFLQSLNNSFCLVEPAAGYSPTFLPPPPVKSTQWLLDLQGIDWKKCAPGPLEDLCRDHGITLPASALVDVEIGGQRFDCVWNSGTNFLNFLVLVDAYKKEDTRNLLAICLDKKCLNGLYSRHIHVLAAGDETVTRLRLEGQGKVKPWRLDWCSPPESEAGREVGRKLKDLFKDLADRKSKPWRPPKVRPAELKPLKTLVVVSGHSDATLTAIVSHACPQVIVCHTEADSRINDITEGLAQKASELGVQNLIKWPTTHEAWDLLDSLPRTFGAPIEVNISPGGKAHGAVLALWARRIGAAVWGFNHGERGDSTLERLPLAGEATAGFEPERKQQTPVSLATHLKIFSAAEVLDFGRAPEDFSEPFYGHMLDFMHRLLESGKWPKNFWTGPFGREGFQLSGGYAEGRRELIWPETADGPAGSYVFSTLSASGNFTGFWYEELVAKAIRNLDPGWEIRVGVKVDWHKAGLVPNQALHGKQHLTERDVLVRTDSGVLYLVSCKAYSPKGDKLISAAREVESMAKVLGRFTVPLLLTMSSGRPSLVEGVMTCGWTTLCDPGRLRDFLKNAVALAWGESSPSELTRR